MMPPRYLLRKATVLELLRGRPRGRFLELGYGSGDFLATLGAQGFTGAGYDVSPAARAAATRRLQRAGITGLELADAPPPGPFDYIFFFEVMGYWSDPPAELRRLAAQLSPQGRLVFSFLNVRQQGAADRLTGNYRGFTRAQVVGFLEQAGLEAEEIWNYGYPLANLLKPALDLYHRVRAFFRPQRGERPEMEQSGLSEQQLANQAAGALFNPLFILPFVRAQRWFRRTDRGAGYVVLARPAGRR